MFEMFDLRVACDLITGARTQAFHGSTMQLSITIDELLHGARRNGAKLDSLRPVDENAVRQPKAVGPVDSHGGNASTKAGMSDALGVTALHDRLPVDVAWNE